MRPVEARKPDDDGTAARKRETGKPLHRFQGLPDGKRPLTVIVLNSGIWRALGAAEKLCRGFLVCPSRFRQCSVAAIFAGGVVRPWKANDYWVIAKNIRPIKSAGITGSRLQSNRSGTLHDSWTGTGWAKQLSMAMKFPSEEAAQAYIDEHYERIADSA
jgi:hypothetical protein